MFVAELILALGVLLFGVAVLVNALEQRKMTEMFIELTKECAEILKPYVENVLKELE